MKVLTFYPQKTKRVTTKGQNRFRISHTFFHTFWHFLIIFPPGLSPSKPRVLAQWEQKRRKDNIKNGDESMLHVSCCTFVLLQFYPKKTRKGGTAVKHRLDKYHPTARGSEKHCPVSPYPLNSGGAISPPKFWGWSVWNPLFYSVFCGPPPKFRGWNWHPLNLGGMGWQGGSAHRNAHSRKARRSCGMPRKVSQQPAVPLLTRRIP